MASNATHARAQRTRSHVKNNKSKYCHLDLQSARGKKNILNQKDFEKFKCLGNYQYYTNSVHVTFTKALCQQVCILVHF